MGALLEPADGLDSANPDRDRWVFHWTDPNLREPPAPGTPGDCPPGEDLNLAIGWDRFEKLLLAVVSGARGLRGVKFRRYGVQGQAQHGIDLAGREPDGGYTVVQCKDYKKFTAGDLCAAVELFALGKRPFGAERLIVATSAETQTTQVADQLAALQKQYPELDLELWGAEQINEYLRYRADVVARFWTRETAATFCSGSPLPGVPMPPLDRQEQADRILLGPLDTSDVRPILREADRKLDVDPGAAAELYRDLADRLTEAGFRGHAIVLRNKQLDALRTVGRIEETAELAARLAVIALHHGDWHEPRRLSFMLQNLVQEAGTKGAEGAADAVNHARVVKAAVSGDLHPLGEWADLRTELESGTDRDMVYRPALVLHLAESVLATDPESIDELDGLVMAAIAQFERYSTSEADEDVLVRLRLVRAEYRAEERRRLLRAAKLRRVEGRSRALINAREARRCCLEGRAEEALEHWRDAIHDGILAGMAEEAADWLYATRALNVNYGPWEDLDDDHRLAQALRGTGTSRLLNRVRDPRERAMSAHAGGSTIEAVHAVRRWLADSVVTASWQSENDALAFLGDLYRDNAEPGLAARYYQRSGRPKKTKELADGVGDRLLPLPDFSGGPWWVLNAGAVLVDAQADLIDDASASTLLGQLMELAARGRRGELNESPHLTLTIQAAKSACALAGRGTSAQAAALLDFLAADVRRSEHHYRETDDAHADACVEIAGAHPGLASAALLRLFDLADQGVDRALSLILDARVLSLLGAPSLQRRGPHPSVRYETLPAETCQALGARVRNLSGRGHYLVPLIQDEFDPGSSEVYLRRQEARDRILNRPSPDPSRVEIGTTMVADSALVSGLGIEDRRRCLARLLAAAEDSREMASNRQEALIAARNLVLDKALLDSSEAFRVAEQSSLANFERAGRRGRRDVLRGARPGRGRESAVL
ncbi:hypothetical protein, partial [Kitasatospora sp. NPDC054795]